MSSLNCREIMFCVNPTHCMKTLWTILGKEESVIVEAVPLQTASLFSLLRWTAMSWTVSKRVVGE
jgi:hypothetical protein